MDFCFFIYSISIMPENFEVSKCIMNIQRFSIFSFWLKALLHNFMYVFLGVYLTSLLNYFSVMNEING